MKAIAPSLRAKKWPCSSHPQLEGVILFLRASRYRHHVVAHFRRILDGQVSQSTDSDYLRSIVAFGSDMSEVAENKTSRSTLSLVFGDDTVDNFHSVHPPVGPAD